MKDQIPIPKKSIRTELFPCIFNNCKMMFRTPMLLKQHWSKHLSSRNFHCAHPGCNKSFKIEQHLMRHKALHAEKSDEKYVCEFEGCGKHFKYEWILRDHYKAAHENQFKFNCEFCTKKYGTKSSLEVHMRGHFGVKPFKC